MDLKEALSNVVGKSPLADVIIKRRFGNMVAEASTNPSSDTLSEEEREAVLDAVAHASYSKRGDSAVRELSSVVLHLLDELAQAHERNQPEEESEEDGAEETVQKMAVFRESILGARVGDLKCYYTENLFKGMKRKTRALIAAELVEHAESHNKEPARIWSVLVQNNGNL